MNNNNDTPYNFALIAPYGNLAAVFLRLAAGMPCNLSIREGVSLDEAVIVARIVVAEEKPDVIISRGGTADYIRSNVDTHVVSISTTPLDLLRTLYPFSKIVTKVAFFNYREPMPEVQIVAKVLGINIVEYLFNSHDNLISCMLAAKANGVQLGVGGVLVAKMRELCGLDGILLEVGEDAVQRSLREAFAIANVRKIEQQRQASIVTILNTITEGIIATDDKNTITLMNPMAEKILNVSAHEAIGCDVSSIIPNTRIGNVLQSGIPELNEVQDSCGQVLVTNRVPIFVENKAVGVICTFTEADRIHQAEYRLRGRLKRKGFQGRYKFSDIITNDSHMQEIKNLAHTYAQTQATIILQGDSGTGKELFAQGIHNSSKRGNGPFVAVNCAAITESLLESELFGYEEGAFTGARRHGRAGFFEMAHEGTLFLDEISELPHHVQAHLLRVVQEQEIIRVGGGQVIPVDVRIICATNRNLENLVQEGGFRHDLFYRLNVLSLNIPPLRQRGEDILLLAAHFLANKFGAKDVSVLSASLKKNIADLLFAYSWPGNVRELRNVIERLSLAINMFPQKTMRELLVHVWKPLANNISQSNKTTNFPKGSLKDITKQLEFDIIQQMLEEYNNNHNKVADILGISRMSLWRKINNR